MVHGSACLKLGLLVAPLAVCGWVCYAAPTLEPRQFTACTGTLTVAQESRGGRSGLLTFGLTECDVRFCVPEPYYDEAFDREAFFANVKPGSKVSLIAEASQLATPLQPLLTPPTVFVYGLWDEQRTYFRLEDCVKISTAQQRGALAFATVMTGLAVWLLYRYVITRNDDIDAIGPLPTGARKGQE